MHWIAWLVVRGSRTILLWAIDMIRRVVVPSLPWKCIALKMHCHALFVLYCSKTAFCRNTWSTDHIQCWSAKHFWPRSLHSVDGTISLADGLTSWSMTSQHAHKVIQKLAQFSEVQSSANRGNMWHGDGFPSEAVRACMHPSSQCCFTVFIV